MHREVLQYEGPDFVDHIDCNGLNNRKSNLRIATALQNAANKRMSLGNSTGFKGVTEPRLGRFVAQIGHNGNKYHIGTFDTPEEAHEAYIKAARELFGEFARAA